MKEGLGAIEIVYTASFPGGGAKRRLIFENHHQSRISNYLVNCLVPQDHAIEILAQHRTDDQSFYQLDYAQAGER
jgi:hypothetical protein